MNNIEIYTSTTCPYCLKAKKLFQMLKLKYTEYNVEKDFDKMCNELSEKYNRQITTVPQIIINNKYIGGYSDLETIYKNNELNKFLN